MKKYLVIIAMMMALGTTQQVTAQSQNPKNGQELVDSARQDELEAYSDTTISSYDSTVVSRQHRLGSYVTGGSFVHDIFGDIGVEGMMGMTFVLVIILIIFVIAPVLILGILLFFVYKNRKQNVRMAEMAIKQGQPIPDQLLDDRKATTDELWQKGLRQTFLGVGLLAFFGYVGSTLGVGIGILVTVIGLGKLTIVKTSK